jgi:hypothetical protein
MVIKECLDLLGIAAICVSAMSACAQIQLDLRREIHLPVPSSRGSYSHWPISELSAKGHFSWQIVRDESILAFDSDTSGNWPLVRVKKWWTEHPVTETLNIPGWDSSVSKEMAGIRVDMQVTPEGHYAVTFAEAVWMAKSDYLIHVPRGFVQRKPDTIITVIDLQRWQIVNSIHTADIEDIDIRDARVVNGSWIAIDETLRTLSPPKDGAYPYSNRLISIPDLKPGPECVSQRISHLGPKPPDSVVESIRKQNDWECREVLEATGVNSEKALETLIQRGSDVEPDAIKIRSLDAAASALSEEVSLWTAERHREQFFRHWGEYPYYDHYVENPPLESASRFWYGLYSSDERPFYELGQYDARGQKVEFRTIRHLACGDPSLDSRNSACGCRVVDVSEEHHALLSYCRTQRGDFEGAVRRQWLAIFRTDDLSDVGIINLPKYSMTFLKIASGDGHVYVLTLEDGEMVRVYVIPDRP